MADNSSLPVASGNETFANDDIAGVKYPRPKINWGPDGTANDVDVASGKPLPIQVRSATGLIPIGEPTDAKSTATDTTSASAISIWKQISASVQALNTAIGSTLWDLGVGTGGTRTQRVAIDTASQNANGQTTMANSAPVTMASDQSSIPVTPAGNVAHDAADSGNPVKQGFKATTALSGLTLVASADRTDGFAGIDGVQIVRPHCNLEDIVTGNATNTDGTSTQCIAAQAAGIKTYLVSVVLANTSATAITVDIKDGTTIKTSLPLPAGSGCVYNPPIPIPGTAATAWNFDGSAAATTVTCSMVGFKSKV